MKSLVIFIFSSSLLVAFLSSGTKEPGVFSLDEEIAIHVRTATKNASISAYPTFSVHEFKALCAFYPELKVATNHDESIPVQTLSILNPVTGQMEVYFPNGVGMLYPIEYTNEQLLIGLLFGNDNIRTFHYETVQFCFIFYLKTDIS